MTAAPDCLRRIPGQLPLLSPSSSRSRSPAGRHVESGSSAMRAQLMVLDGDPRVVGLAGRPGRLLWRDRQGALAPGCRSCSPGTRTAPPCRRTAPATRTRAGSGRYEPGRWSRPRATRSVGTTAAEPLDPVVAAHLTWPASYRHPRNRGRLGLAAALREAFTRPRPPIEGVEAVGDPLEVLPVVFHALWPGHLAGI